MKHLFRGIRNTVIVLLALAVALTGFTRFIHYPNPIAAIKLGLRVLQERHDAGNQTPFLLGR